MSIPAEKLNMTMEELLSSSSKSAKELNIISLEEYKKLNADKVAYLSFLKKCVAFFNNTPYHKWLDMQTNFEIIHLTAAKLFELNAFSDEKKALQKKLLGELNELFFIQNIILNDVKNYPNPRLKKSSLKLNDKTYKSFLRTKNRLLEIQQEIEQYNFNPPDYMKDALEHIEHIIKKYEEYKDNPEALLDLFDYYYTDIEDQEWTDEDREFVAKHYG